MWLNYQKQVITADCNHCCCCNWNLYVLWTTGLLLTLSPTNLATVSLTLSHNDWTVTRNCSYNDFICEYKLVNCSNYSYPRNINQPSEFMLEARIDSATPMFIGKNDIFHFLQVTVTFCIYPKRYSSSDELNFLLSVKQVNDKELETRCFLLDMKKTNLTRVQPGRKKFSMTLRPEDFKFGGIYNFTLISSPTLSEPKDYFHILYKMPLDPEVFQDNADCKNYSAPNGNKQASKWYASFLTIKKQEVKRLLYVSFIGAPPGFCFEEYILALKGGKETRQTKISVENMKQRVIYNKTYLVGEHVFTGLTLGEEYQPVVVAVSQSKREVIVNGKKQRKCLCRPTRLIDEQIAAGCICIFSKYQTVVLDRLQRPSFSTAINSSNGTFVSVPPMRENTAILHIALFAVVVIVLFLLGLIYLMFVKFYRQYHQRKILIHFGVSSNRPTEKSVFFPTDSPLIRRDRTNVLILYSHDSQPHDDAVVALASLLQEVLGFNVLIDYWESSEIESNTMDYVSTSVQKADRIIIVNSVGAFKRYESKTEHGNRIERINRGPFDELFAMQIDQALGRQPCILSVRFVYTPSLYVLSPLSVSLQYVLPDNLGSLQTTLCKFGGDPLKVDPSSQHMLKMTTAIARMSSFITAEPDWFEKTHCFITPKSLLKQTPVLSTLNEGSDDTLTLEHKSGITKMTSSTRKTPEDITEMRKSLSRVESESDVNGADGSVVVDGKLDSGIHTEEECYNSESIPSLKKSRVYIGDSNTNDAVVMKKIENTFIIKKTDSGYVGETRGLNVYS